MTLPIFFTDRSLGKHIVAEGVRKLGLQIQIHDQLFPQNAPDEVWIPEVSKRNWAAITADTKIMQRPNARNAVKSEKIRLFVIRSKKPLTGLQYVEIIENHLQAIKILAAFVPPPYISKLTRTNVGFEWLGSLEELAL